MANWVSDILQLNPDLAAMPVVKRARRSLHLRRPDGVTLGLFTGAPCHFQDEGGEWQPLDTMPLYDVGRGLWYCPGLNVVITEAGEVRLGDYSQWTKRVGLFRPSTMELLGTRDVPLGSRVGDSLVGERDEWRVERRITATGYRELLTLQTKPDLAAAQVGDYLVLETWVGGVSMPNGWVEGQYNIAAHWSPMPVAWDANGEPLTCRRYWRDGVLYTGIPVTELAHAIYPVTIDPDFTGSTADGYIYGLNVTYATARSTATGFTLTDVSLSCGQLFGGGNFDCLRSFLKFDTSGIGPGQNILQDNLNATLYKNYSDTDFNMQIVKQDWSAQEPIGWGTYDAAYDACLAGTLDQVWRNTAGIGTETNYTSPNLDVTWVQPEGITYYSLRSDRDKDATEPSGSEYVILYAKENGSKDPYLTILYEAAGGNGDISVTPAAGTFIARSVAPSVTLGSLSISPAALSVVTRSVAPSVTMGSLSISPSASSAILKSIAPIVVLGSLSLTPAASAAVLKAVAPSVTLGSLSISPAAASAILAGVAPSVVLGSLSIGPAAASAILKSIGPTVLMQVEITPAAASMILRSVDPSVVQASLSITPSAATFVAKSVDPTVNVWVIVTSGVSVREAYAIVQYALSNGLLAAAEADVYEAPALRQSQLVLLLLHNIHASNSNDVEMFLQVNGGTSRRLFKKTVATGETLFVEEEDGAGLQLDEGDKIRGLATSADEVTWTVSARERYRV